MNDEEKLDLLRDLLEIEDSSKDTLLAVYLSLAGEKILQKAYPFDDDRVEVPRKYSFIQCQIAQYLYNKRGAEGQTYHSESGINRTYENADIPKSMLKDVVPFVEVL